MRQLLCLLGLIYGGYGFSTSQRTNTTISPPWNILTSIVQSTVGADPCLSVSGLKGQDPNYELYVQVICAGSERVRDVATVVTRKEVMGNVLVDIKVLDNNGTVVPAGVKPSHVLEAMSLYNRTLFSNPLYNGVVSGNPLYAFYLLFAKTVVQFYADNVADAYGNKNMVTADAFSQALALPQYPKLRISATTSE
jgi:hypothetical protein